MTALAITKCDPVLVELQFTGPAEEPIAEGDRCRFDATTGGITLGEGDSAAEIAPGGIALNAAAAGATVTIVNKGIVDISPLTAFDALDFGAPIYVSDTAGQFSADPDDGTVDTIVGRVIPGWDGTAAQKLLYLNGL